MIKTEELRERLLGHLGRGGSWSYYFTLPQRKSSWHPVGENGTIPPGEHIYFGVNPTAARKKDHERAEKVDVIAVNTLFADHDAKDFGGNKEAALQRITAIPLPPSVVIDSGGGYQSYWLFDTPFMINTDADRARIDAVQKSWVRFVGSDDGAKDLARILRVPGTVNRKYDPPRPVAFHSTEWCLYDLADLEAISAPMQPVERSESDTTSPGTPKIADRYGQAALDGELQRVRGAREGTRNTSLNVAAYYLGQLIGANVLDRTTVEEALLNAARSVGLTEQEAARTVKSGLGDGIAKPRQIKTRTDPHQDKHKTTATDATDTGATDTKSMGEILRDKPLTDWGNAECIEELCGDLLRYCHTRKKWYCWNGEMWQEDKDGRVKRTMAKTVRARQKEIANIADDDKKKRYASWVVNSENRKRLDDAINLAGSLIGFASTIDQYDRDPMLANAGVVTLDLQTGEPRPNSHEDYITRRLGADYDPAATCPRWLQFLAEVFNDDADLIGYIRRAVGYSLTGDTREQKLFLAYGGGANGKSVFLTAIAKLAGDYGAARTFTTFDADERNRIGDDLAGLKGTRFVSVIETNEDRRLNEARIKSLTGQDEISCRFLFGEYFSFRPAFKLWLAMNHKPTIYGVDRGIWRRIQLIPFTQLFEGERQDKTLDRQLEAELPGVLNWALQGLREWNAVGLKPPLAVTNATESYQRESDIVGQWLESCTESGALMQMKSGDGYKSYKAWCDSQGIKAFSNVIWGRRLVERGITTIPRTTKGIFYQGIGLVTVEQ